MRVLDDVNARSLASFWAGILCMVPMHWIRKWGLSYGIYLWVSTLVMEIEGRRFWVERGCVMDFFFRSRLPVPRLALQTVHLHQDAALDRLQIQYLRSRFIRQR